MASWLRSYSKKVTDGVAQLRPIEGVEMEVTDAAGIELAAQLGGDGGSDQLACRRKVVQPLEKAVQPFGYAGAAGFREAAGLGDVRDRKDPGHDLDVHSGVGHCILEAQEAVGREEELRDRAVGAGVDLALQIVEVGLAGSRIRMDLGVSGDRNLERSNLLQAFDEGGCIGIAAGMVAEACSRLDGIAAKRNDVTNSKLPIVARDRVDLI